MFGKGVEGEADRPGVGCFVKDIKGNQALTILLRLEKRHDGLTLGVEGDLLECRGMHVRPSGVDAGGGWFAWFVATNAGFWSGCLSRCRMVPYRSGCVLRDADARSVIRVFKVSWGSGLPCRGLASYQIRSCSWLCRMNELPGGG